MIILKAIALEFTRTQGDRHSPNKIWEAPTMVSTPKPNMPVIRASKINHKSAILHPLVRFVTEETVALLLNLELEEIYRIDCWRHVVYVHGKGVSKFVSYADFPPILAFFAGSPTPYLYPGKALGWIGGLT